MTEHREALAALLHEAAIGCVMGVWLDCPSEYHARQADALIAAGVHLGDEGLREANAKLRELLREIIEDYHQVGSIRDHADPNDRTGWNVHGIETCEDRYCVDALALLAAQENPT